MKTKIKVQAILCLILIVVTTLMQSPTEAKAYALCEPCFAEKQAGGAYGYRYYYIVDLSGAVTEYVYNGKANQWRNRRTTLSLYAGGVSDSSHQ